MTTTHLAKTLTKALDLLIKTIKLDALLYKARTGINIFYDIENAVDVKEKIEEINNSKENIDSALIQTADITGWYDNIEHMDAIKVISKIIYETFMDIKRRKYIKIKGDTAIWTNTFEESTYSIHIFTAASLLKLIVWRLRNQFSKVGNKIIKQIIGTGQGDNHSGHLCRLISIYYERKFAKYWAEKDKKIALAFNNTIRKHDDYAFFTNLSISKYLIRKGNTPGIIPQYFTLKWTNTEPEASNYLDTHIHKIENPYLNKENKYTKEAFSKAPIEYLRNEAKRLGLKQSGQKDILIKRLLQSKLPINNYKRNEFNVEFNINSFPYFHTNLVGHSTTGTVYGQLHSLLVTNAIKYEDYMKNVVHLFRRLHKINGYPIPLLNNIFRKFISLRDGIYRKRFKKVIADYYTHMFKMGLHRPRP